MLLAKQWYFFCFAHPKTITVAVTAVQVGSGALITCTCPPLAAEVLASASVIAKYVLLSSLSCTSLGPKCSLKCSTSDLTAGVSTGSRQKHFPMSIFFASLLKYSIMPRRFALCVTLSPVWTKPHNLTFRSESSTSAHLPKQQILVYSLITYVPKNVY